MGLLAACAAGFIATAVRDWTCSRCTCGCTHRKL